MALLTVCQHTFQNVTAYEEAVEDVAALKVNVQECYTEITKTSEQIQSSVRETYISKSEMETIQQDFQTSITESSTEIRMDFQSSLDVVSGQVSENQALLEEYIRFRGALIELGKVGNAFTAELSNEQLAFKENGQTIAYISNQSLVITNAEIRNKLSLGNEDRGWFDFIPRTSGNLSIVWRRSGILRRLTAHGFQWFLFRLHLQRSLCSALTGRRRRMCRRIPAPSQQKSTWSMTGVWTLALVPPIP